MFNFTLKIEAAPADNQNRGASWSFQARCTPIFVLIDSAVSLVPKAEDNRAQAEKERLIHVFATKFVFEIV